jgi:sugar transferase (PEP-CTERM/EpsH1 system associated)
MSPAPAPPLIAHVIYRLDFGGLENGLVNLLNRMPPERYRHAIVCLAGYGEAFRQRLRRDDVPVISLDKQPGKDPGVYLRMLRTLRRLRPDVVHTRNLGTVDMQWIAALSGVPHRVHGEHGWEASDPQGLHPKGLRIRRACRPVIHRYVPMSQDIARWLERSVGVPREKIRQLYSGVDVQKFFPSPKPSPADAGEGFRTPSPALAGEGRGEGLVLGTIGRLDPVKNQAALIEAFATLRTSHPRLRLVIVGDGPLRASLQQLATDLGVADAVTFTGARSDTPDLLRSFDVFVLPSINEGISNTILEAMASGLPVVAGRVGGNPELVADGLTGSLYGGSDASSLARALRPYVTDSALRRAHGEAARARVVQNFSLDSMVARYLALYDDLLGS